MANQTKLIYEFNKADPVYRAEPREDGGIDLYFKGCFSPLLNEFESTNDFENWAFEGGDAT